MDTDTDRMKDTRIYDLEKQVDALAEAVRLMEKSPRLKLSDLTASEVAVVATAFRALHAVDIDRGFILGRSKAHHSHVLVVIDVETGEVERIREDDGNFVASIAHAAERSGLTYQQALTRLLLGEKLVSPGGRFLRKLEKGEGT